MTQLNECLPEILQNYTAETSGTWTKCVAFGKAWDRKGRHGKVANSVSTDLQSKEGIKSFYYNTSLPKLKSVQQLVRLSSLSMCVLQFAGLQEHGNQFHLTLLRNASWDFKPRFWSFIT